MSQSPEAMKVWREAQSVFDEHPEGPFADTDAADVAAASVIEAALQKARDGERAAVVAWLDDANKKDGADGWNIGLISLGIERGEHRREG
jgi:hypothetical protein